MKKQLYIACLILAGASLLYSCTKQLEVTPRQSITIEQVLSSRENVSAFITGIYSRLKSVRLYGRDLIAIPEALADNGFATNKSGRLIGEAANNAGAHFTTAVFQVNYFGIAEINIVLAALPTLNFTPAITAAEKASWEGQLRFLRALFYFDMMRVYTYEPGMGVPGQDRGGLPLLLSTPSTAAEAVASLPPRARVDTIYGQIYRDLTAANSLLLPSTASAVFPAFATRAAAQALFARVALYNRDYANAKRWADSAINLVGSRLSTAGAYVAAWRSPVHPESIFELRYQNLAENIGVNESLQTSYSTLVTVGNPNVVGGFGDLVPTTTLLTDLGITATFAGGVVSARTDDVRNLLYEQGSAARGTARVECTKFLGKNGTINLDNIPVLRVAEMYLIRAEAMATVGSPVLNLTASLADLVRIKQNRYSNYAVTQAAFDATLTTQPALFAEILKQRRLEFAFEGHRFFDLKRLGRDLIKTPHYNNVAYTDFRILPPMPQREIDINFNITQNFGY